MIYVLCGELDKACASKEKIAELKARFGNADSDLYIDNICARKSEGSKAESLCALWGLARLAEKANFDLSGLSLAKTENGKPYFKNSDLHFSVSHSGDNSHTGDNSHSGNSSYSGKFACVLSEKRVGIDIESKKLSDEKAIRAAERFFSPCELEFVKTDPKKNFQRVWTAKEACTKMLGVTLSEGLKRADLFSEEFWFYSFEYKDAFVTLCSDGKEEVIRF